MSPYQGGGGDIDLVRILLALMLALASMKNQLMGFNFICMDTVEPVLNGHSKMDKTKILMTNGSLMKVESIAECSPWSILQYF